MNRSIRTATLFLQIPALAIAGAFFAGNALAWQAEAPKQAEVRKDLVLKGDAKCTRCHDAEDNPQLLAIGKTKHGTRADGRTPTCTSCHGESETHVNKPANATERPLPDRMFAKRSSTPIAERNEACMGCHRRDSARSHWEGSQHQNAEVACTSCHEIHTQHDKVRVKLTQPEVCFACHKEHRAMINRPSRHPIPEGKVTCSDCHNPHGSVGPKLVKRDSVNDTCYTCHMEKRGPFVHNHEPVAEDCMNCHNPHGSVGPKLVKRDSVNDTCYTCHMEKRGPFVHNHEPVAEDCMNCHNPHGTVVENMLKARPPFLCHQCHTPHGPNVPQVRGRQVVPDTVGTTGKNPINITMARGCLNCHTEVHGSNNPSTTNPTPQFRLR
jgi:DmsE family decaheme c-type cytochrome